MVEHSTNIIPIPRCSIDIRPATKSDYPFIDRLQDMHSKALGFMPRAQLQGKIDAGQVLIAEDEMRLAIGYCMSQDRYFKRDDLGIIYQMNVLPTKQRSLVGATLVRAVFERAAYGCRLFCCWCAQDLDANYFWESLGFVPLAFRTGASGRSARGQSRTHIFWQRRVRAGDVTTPYWFPCKTDGGMMREDRLVLPIPPGVHWKDEMPVLLPEAQKALPGQGRSGGTPKPRKGPDVTKGPIRMCPGQFAPPGKKMPSMEKSEKVKSVRVARVKVKVDPKVIAAARELRDRYLEQFNRGLMEGPQGKYAVARIIAPPPSHALPAAA